MLEFEAVANPFPEQRAVMWRAGDVWIICAAYAFGQFRVRVWLGDYSTGRGTIIGPEC